MLAKPRCGPDEILRNGFFRRSHIRKSYINKNGTKIPKILVSKSKVNPVCIKNIGKPGKGPKTLPRPDNKFRLTPFGYAINKSTSERRKALRDASRKYGVKAVYLRLNLLRNYQAIPENKKKFNEDIIYMKMLFEPYRKKKQKQNGGASMQSFMQFQSTCVNGTKCNSSTYIREEHDTKGKRVVYYTLDPNNSNDIDSMQKINESNDRESIKQYLKDNEGFIIGVRVNGELQGYAQYQESNDKAKILHFISNKGYGITLHIFLEKYFRAQGFKRIVIATDSEKIKNQWQFWFKLGYLVQHQSDHKSYLEKTLYSMLN